MKVLVVGQGGREHALLWKLKQSPSVDEVFCAPGNAGTAADGLNVDISDSDVAGLVKFAVREQIGLAVVGPEVPLCAGIVDAFERAGVKAFGPSKAAAQLEGSKIFAKQVMRRANIPTASVEIFDRAEEAIGWLSKQEDQPWVVKADGLAAGKGAIVCANREEAVDAITLILTQRAFGDAGKQLIIEECLVGEEASILAIVDGTTIVPLETSQDHKRAYDNDEGPNTGGMGAYCPAPLVTPEMMETILQKVLLPTVHAMHTADTPFRGILYAGIMLTDTGPKVLEYNVRFGDPEAQPVLMRLKSDLAQVLLAAADHRLEEIEPLEWDPRPAICVVMASEGYPGSYEKGRAIAGLDAAAELGDVKVFHAGTSLKSGKVVNNGGRVLGVTALGDDLPAAKARAYEAVRRIQWNGGWYRSDISDKATTND
ncbi:MAG: phosphoribosylamine--glycine ligase [Planctomycetota bacterium]|nr:phosphoribosylamine--glycine ligase [Planctomycetota bacterium]MDA1163114.1 phosphoribosylamine--glycine ligase [Planctomycetota bacterium]